MTLGNNISIEGAPLEVNLSDEPKI
jgi:hypothetical protein